MSGQSDKPFLQEAVVDHNSDVVVEGTSDGADSWRDISDEPHAAAEAYREVTDTRRTSRWGRVLDWAGFASPAARNAAEIDRYKEHGTTSTGQTPTAARRFAR